MAGAVARALLDERGGVRVVSCNGAATVTPPPDSFNFRTLPGILLAGAPQLPEVRHF
jgi:hypothetical protein